MLSRSPSLSGSLDKERDERELALTTRSHRKVTLADVLDVSANKRV